MNKNEDGRRDLWYVHGAGRPGVNPTTPGKRRQRRDPKSFFNLGYREGFQPCYPNKEVVREYCFRR